MSKGSARRGQMAKDAIRDHGREWQLAKARRSLKRRSSEEWLDAIRRLRCGRLCRLLVSQIVWWDYFSNKPATPHDPAFDAYKADWEYMVVCRKPIRIRDTSIAAALIALGYQQDLAIKRSQVVNETAL
jgi:hypothetical protein